MLVHEVQPDVGHPLWWRLSGTWWSTHEDALDWLQVLGITREFPFLPLGNGHIFDSGERYKIAGKKALFYMVGKGARARERWTPPCWSRLGPVGVEVRLTAP